MCFVCIWVSLADSLLVEWCWGEFCRFVGVMEGEFFEAPMSANPPEMEEGVQAANLLTVYSRQQ